MTSLAINSSEINYRQPLAALALLTMVMIATTTTQAATYNIVPDNSNVRFEIDHFKTSTNSGGFYNLTGQLEYDPKAQLGKVSILIPINSINTGNIAFDNVLKSDEFFDAQKFPVATFDSTKWYFAPDKSNDSKSLVTKVDGNLTMRGITHPVTLMASKFNCYLSFIAKAQVCGGDFTTTIDRRKWDISKYTLLGITENVTLNIQIEAAKQ